MAIEMKMRVQGILRLYEVDPSVKTPLADIKLAIKQGRARKVLETKNMVVDRGLQVLAALLAGGAGVHTIGGGGYGPTNFDTLRIQRMDIGDAGAPPAPTPADTALFDGTPAYSFRDNYPTAGDQLLTSMQLGTPGEVVFSGLIQPQELQGVTITEEALFTESGIMFARTTFSYLKQNNVGVQLEHTISLARA